MKIVRDRIEIAFRDEGEGLPVVLLHGFPFSSRMWNRQVAALAPSHRMITPDFRGFGDSGGAPSSAEQLADDLQALVEHLELPRFVLGGFSMGGYVAFRYLAKHADRVHAVMLLDTRAEADAPEAKQRRYTAIDRIKSEGADGFLNDFAKLVLSPKTLERRPEIATQVRQLMEADRVASLIGGLQAIAERPDSTPLLSKITQPALIVVGEDDKATPVDSARKMHEAIPGSTLVIIPEAGHVSNLEQPEQFNKALREFLAQV
ncbi:MAG: alpha/beta hydrolase [Armatimonadetes bacterium]|nr:alpha/beta hydrolase [Armatimonadota bacterium]MBI2972587.1 alpha/beta hydrolase [Armatimonadota bacterium]